MLLINISEAKAQLSSLIEKVKAGEDVIICKAGKPVVRLIKYEVKKIPRKPGALKGKIIIEDDFDGLPSDIDWPDFAEDAIELKGKPVSDQIIDDRKKHF